MGFVFQFLSPDAWRTIRANVASRWRCTASRRRGVRSAPTLPQMVGLRRFAESYPSELSGGMKQRAALARALVASRASC